MPSGVYKHVNKNRPWLGKHLSEEHKRKIGEGNKGKKRSEEHINKLKLSHKSKGVKLTEETKRKISEAQKGSKNHFYGKHHTEEWKKIISNKLKGRKFSEEWRNKIKEKRKNQKIVISDETKRKLSLALSGEKGSNWKGGISKLPYPLGWTEILKESIRKRDNYKCQMCGKSQNEFKRKLAIHHKDYDKNNLDPNNLISLCSSCHGKTNNHNKYWIEYFKNK